ncbi:hypothetical protein GQ53DRAFT_456049 [Thozetella sp. PMI_491]|nr:hypothetical protein GQ53DRAFT_456049 [Thozetella sp. PMI_491]
MATLPPSHAPGTSTDPASACLPTLSRLPVWYANYWVLIRLTRQACYEGGVSRCGLHATLLHPTEWRGSPVPAARRRGDVLAVVRSQPAVSGPSGAGGEIESRQRRRSLPNQVPASPRCSDESSPVPCSLGPTLPPELKPPALSTDTLPPVRPPPHLSDLPSQSQ